MVTILWKKLRDPSKILCTKKSTSSLSWYLPAVQVYVITMTRNEEIRWSNLSDHRHLVYLSYVNTVVKNLGLCVLLTDYLTWVLQISAIVQVTISLPGLLGAALSLRVTCSRQKRSSLSVQVALLSLYDLLFLFAVSLLAIFELLDITDEAVVDPFLVLQQLAHFGVTYTLLDISIERCISIDRPFLARRVCGVGFTIKRAAVVFALGFVFTIPFVVDLVYHFSTGDECERERSLTVYGIVYTLYTVILFFTLLPFACILVANARLVYTLRHVGQRTRAMAANSVPVAQKDSSARQLSFFVVGMSTWYVICMLVPSILFLVRLTRIELFEPESDVVAAVVADILIVLSATANFFFYFLLWRHFRHTFLAIFCSKCRNADLISSTSGKNSPDRDQICSSNHHSPDRDQICSSNHHSPDSGPMACHQDQSLDFDHMACHQDQSPESSIHTGCHTLSRDFTTAASSKTPLVSD